MENDSEGKDEGDEGVAKSEQSFFSDWPTVQQLINELCEDGWENEQPTLLGPYLENFVTPITKKLLAIMENLGLFKQDATSTTFLQFQRMESSQFHALCKLLQLFCRVRGFKHVVKFFPHEVSHVEACVLSLNAQDRNDHSTWETRYVLLLWLYILVLIPFDICSIDSSLHTISTTDSSTGQTGEETKSKLIVDIISLCKEQLTESGPTRDAASACLSVLFTRPDIETSLLAEFISWCCVRLKLWATKGESASMDLSRDTFQIIGVLHCLSQIFKRGHRNNLHHHAMSCLAVCLLISNQTNQTLIRKLIIKVFQRIALIFLPPKEAKWRYQRGSRSLLQNLVTSYQPQDSNSKDNKCKDHDEDEELDFDVPSDLEDIVGKLLGALQDKDTVVRWSAAKGIGRITMRLPLVYGDDIVSAIVSSFAEEDAESGWHGACLALAELSRRGLLLPNRLEEVVPIVAKAIHFDVMKGQHSVGTHVRDAACYVCWAFARAYAPLIMRPYVQQLSDAMILTALFDREINCRRAASAAFQENVGRQGNENFPNGIEIITMADYFSLGNRNNAFLKISPLIARLTPHFNYTIMNHLSTVKLGHWDPEIRMLTSKTLAKLSTISVNHSISILRMLIPQCISLNMSQRHGSVLAVSEMMYAISLTDHVIEADLVEEISQLVFKIDKARLYRGRGSELLRQASCVLIESIAKSQLTIPLKTQVSLVETLNENLKQPHESIQKAAASALRQMLFTYFPIATEPSERLQQLTVLKYMNGLNDENVAHVRGYALALGVLPIKLIKSPPNRLNEVFKTLFDSCDPSRCYGGEPDAEIRRNCISSIVEIAERFGSSGLLSSDDNDLSSPRSILQILLKACEDYSIDKRGDIGSWCRITALYGIERFILSLFRSHLNTFPQPTTKFRCNAPVSVSANNDNDRQSFLVPGAHVMSSNGYAVIDSVVEINGAPLLVVLSYPPQSLGSMLNDDNGQSIRVRCRGLETIGLPNAILTHEEFLLPSFEERKQFCESPTNLSLNINSTMSGVQRSQISPLSEMDMKNVFNAILQQLGEKLDTVREVGGGVLQRLLQCQDPFIHCIPDRIRLANGLDSILKTMQSSTGKQSVLVEDQAPPSVKDESACVNWNNYKLCFQYLSGMLESTNYFHSIILGISISIGGLSEGISKESSHALLTWCHHKKVHNMKRDLGELSRTIVSIFQSHLHDSRVVIPLLKTIGVLVRNGVFDWFLNTLENDFASNILNSIVVELQKTTDTKKMKASVDVLILLLMFSDPVRSKALRHIVVLLGNKFPSIRKYVAEQLYIQLISDVHSIGVASSSVEFQNKLLRLESESKTNKSPSDVAPLYSGLTEKQSELDEAMHILTTTVWDDSVDVAREKRLQLCNIMKIELQTVARSKDKKATTKQKGDELDSYDALVRDAGKIRVQ